MGRPLAGTAAWLAPLALLLAACAAPRPELQIEYAGDGPGLVAIRVGGDPHRLAATPDGRVLVVATTELASLSVIDTVRLVEKMRMPVPVRERDAAGEETYGYISDIALTEDGSLAWVCTTEGQVFAIDLARGVIRESRELPGCSPSAIVVDGPRGRVLVGTEEGTILALEPAGTRQIAQPGMFVRWMARHGDLLDFVTGPRAWGGSGVPGGKLEPGPETRLHTLNLATERLVAEAVATSDDVMEFARDPSGLLLAADRWGDRLVVLDPGLSVVDERGTPGRDPDRLTSGFEPSRVERGAGRALACSTSRVAAGILEYGLADGRLSDAPRAEYPGPWTTAAERVVMTELVVLNESWFAVGSCDGDAVYLVHRSWARPFSGFGGE